MRIRGSGLLLAVAAVGWVRCGPDDPPEPADCDTSWEYDASATLRTWCTPCHHSDLEGDARSGAPLSMNFDEYTDVLRAAPQIQSAIDAGLMPPVYPMPEADAEALLAWLSCPTEPVDGTGPVLADCTNPTPLEGTLRASEAPDDLCATPRQVTGDLIVDTDASLLDCICGVDGSVLVTGSATLLNLSQCTAIGGDLMVQDNPNLSVVSLWRLASVGGEVVFQDNPVMTDLQSTSAVRTVGGGIQVQSNQGLVELDAFERVESVGAEIVLSGNDALVEARGLNTLLEAPGVQLEDHANLTELSALLALETVTGDLVIHGNAALTRPGLRDLSAVDGDLVISDNPMLSQAEIDALLTRVTVGGTTTVSGNGP